MMRYFLFIMVFLLLGCKTTQICDFQSNNNNISHLCGVSTPINDGVFYVNTEKKEIIVYRVYDATKPWSMMGRWWVFEKPEGSKDEFRSNNAVCDEWSDLSHVVQATIKKDAIFFIGSTKRVECKDTTYGDTEYLQVFIPQPKKSLKKVKPLGEWKE